MAASFEIKGLDRFRANLGRIAGAAIPAVKRAMFQEAEEIMTVSKTAFVPVDTGALRASGTVLPPEIKGSEVTVTLGYGGGAVDYAVIVHERMGVHHPNGQSKFLEVPVLAASRGMDARLAERIRRDIERAAK